MENRRQQGDAAMQVCEQDGVQCAERSYTIVGDIASNTSITDNMDSINSSTTTGTELR